MLIDTHCHIHDDEYGLNGDEVLVAAQNAGVTKLICVGTDLKYSKQAMAFAADREDVYATIGLHPHDANKTHDMAAIEELDLSPKVVAVGECGLDYFYQNSSKKDQIALLERHFVLANRHSLPMSFHVRGSKDDPNDAFADFWRVYDRFEPRGVMHSFSAYLDQVQDVTKRPNLSFGLNGITTFMKDQSQLEAIKAIPIKKIVLETDAPYLTPVPFRGKINEPKYITTIVKSLADLRDESTEELTKQTTANAKALFGL